MDTSFGGRIQRLRESRSLSQEELAERVGVTKRTIQNIESNKSYPQPKVRRELAKALRVELAELMAPLQGETSANTPQTDSREKVAGPVPDTDSTSDDTDQPTLEEPSGVIPPSPLIEDMSRQSRGRGGPGHQWVIVSVSILILVVLIAIGGIIYWALIGRNIHNTISGQVTCPNNQRVVGIYIVTVSGGSYHVNYRQYLNSSQSVAKFTYTIPDDGAYNLHVGCGGAADNWAKSYNTENCSGPINDRDFHAVIAYDQLPADKSKPCLVWVQQ